MLIIKDVEALIEHLKMMQEGRLYNSECERDIDEAKYDFAIDILREYSEPVDSLAFV